MVKILEEAGLQGGLLNVVVGSGSEIGDAFVSHPVPRVISFTGRPQCRATGGGSLNHQTCRSGAWRQRNLHGSG